MPAQNMRKLMSQQQNKRELMDQELLSMIPRPDNLLPATFTSKKRNDIRVPHAITMDRQFHNQAMEEAKRFRESSYPLKKKN